MVAQVGVFAIECALVNLAADVIAQVGADAWDHTDGGFDRTGDHVVGLLNGEEAATSALQGALSFGLARSGRAFMEEAGGGNVLSKAMLNPITRIATVAGFSVATDTATQLLTTGHVDWEEAATSGGIGGLAGGHGWRAEDVGRVEALGRFHEPATADPARYGSLLPDPGRGGTVKAGIGGGSDEATSVLRLEHAGLIEGPVSRSTNPEVDFVDAAGNNLDVKTEQDIHLGKGAYTLSGAVERINTEVRKGETVIENIAYLSRAHLAS